MISEFMLSFRMRIGGASLTDLSLPAGDALGDRLVADVLRRGEDDDGRVVRGGNVADRHLLLPEKIRIF